MINYLSADLRRIFRKRSFPLAVATFAACFAILVFVYANPGFTAEMYVSKITGFMSYFPLVVGLPTFLAVYADDFECGSMQVAIGYGMPRGRIVVAKLLESAFALLLAATIMAALLIATPQLLGLSPTTQQIFSLALTATVEFLRALGYAAISAVAMFLTQNATGGTIVHVLLSSKAGYIISSIILGQEFLVNTMGNLSNHLYTTLLCAWQAGMLQGEQQYLCLISALLIYVALPTIASVAGFRKKELEF